MSGLTLRRRIVLLLVGALVLTAAFVVVTAVAMRNLSVARAELADRLDPAAATAPQMLTALLDQETGLRGYALTGNRAFLEPWTTGSADEKRLSDQLRDELGAYPVLVDELVKITDASDAWRASFAQPLLAASDVTALPEAAQVQGRAEFDEIRTQFDVFNAAMQDQREQARAALESNANQLRLSLIGLSAVLVGILIALWWSLERWVLAPVGRLSNDTRTVAEGQLDHHVESSGPPEFIELGRDVELMRERIVVALRASELQSAELARSNGELEQFAYVASHDLQEPLRKVASFCQMLQKRYAGQLDERADQYIDFAVDGAKRMQDLINDLLMFSRVGRTTERFVEVDLNTTYDRAMSTLARLRRESGAQVERTALPTIHGDPALLTSLLQNLIGNAIKFRGADTPVIEVGAVEVADGWELWVSDNGIGMDPQYASRVFELFQRLHARSEYEGTGIGLALCRKIVDFHGGRIWVETAPDAGTTVRFTLPREATVSPGALIPVESAS